MPAGPAMPCRPAMAVPNQLTAVPGHKPSPGPLPRPRPPPPPGPLPPLPQPGPLPRPRPLARLGLAVRAVIGDQLRMPVMWCEMGSCISFHADPAALGEADTRARAIGAGWRIDALGRLACPRCQQTDPGFRASGQVVPWDRRTAVARTARASRAAVRSSPPAVLSAAIARPAGRSWNGTAISALPGPCPLADGLNAQPAPPFPRCGAEMRPGPGGLAAAAWRHLAQASENSEDLMIRERAHACSAGAMTWTGRR